MAAGQRQLSRVEHIRRFALLGEEWLPDSETLTPTMKLKRRGVLARYAESIEDALRRWRGGGGARLAAPAPPGSDGPVPIARGWRLGGDRRADGGT